ncbi:MAG: carbohydrate ABC transporter permease [Clostridiales bacterium]|jgi:putative aldouronate transport system permease protein|nr:carbohydrate ABC transporter permease [Clostridiales bacterium]
MASNKKLHKNNWFDYLNMGFAIVFGILILYPFYNSILISFTPQADYVKTPFMLIPKRLTLDSYYVVFESRVLFTGLAVAAFITVTGVVYNMTLTLLMAYCFNKDFPGKKFFLYAVIFTMYFSGGLIPYYLLVKDMGLMDSLFSMVLPTGVSIVYMTVMRKYFAALPEELEESARIDGASDLVILFRIILPLAMPMVVTFGLYYGIERWNEWWNGMLFIKSAYRQPLQLVLRGIIQSTGSQVMSSNLQEAGIVPFTDGVKMASIVITMFPIMCVYPFLQKYFVQGLAIGAVKG